MVPPSGQVNFSAPLSVANTTMVLSAMPSASSLASSSPTTQSSSCIPSAYRPSPVLSRQRSDRRVQTCMRVVLCHNRNGLPAWWARSMKSRERASRSSSMVSMRLRVSGPVSVMVWRPTRPKRSSSVGSSASLALQSSTPRGANSRCIIGLSLG